MIRPPGWDGVAFSEKSDGDIGSDGESRLAAARQLVIRPDWAEVSQVHGNTVTRVDQPGAAGEADALWTSEPGLPLAVFTADCFGVVLVSEGAVGVAHAGWRGAAAGVIERLSSVMATAGHPPSGAAVGPGIGPCCFEVGPEVAQEFDGHLAVTTWGTLSVDLPGVVAGQLGGLETWVSGGCTRHEKTWFSHRENGTPKRMAAIGWLA